LDIQNGDAEFYGDAEKIKSALNELVENSLKHNRDIPDLYITITSNDVTNPFGISKVTKLTKQRYLAITFRDTGSGVPPDKKQWIFLPLRTTAAENAGSGLGLFIIRRTLENMNGFIEETGKQGVQFELFLPYQSESGGTQ
jgi:signal transduction histidine kinase